MIAQSGSVAYPIGSHSAVSSSAVNSSALNSLPRRRASGSAPRGKTARLADRVRAFIEHQRRCRVGNLAVLTARITPIDENGQRGEPHSVILRDLTDRGLSFEHHSPLDDRRAVLSVEDPRFGIFDAEVDLSWSQFRSGGQYTSGGRFVK